MSRTPKIPTVLIVDSRAIDSVFRKAAFLIAYEANLKVQIDDGWVYDTAEVLTDPPAIVRRNAEVGRAIFWKTFAKSFADGDYVGGFDYVDTLKTMARKCQLKIDRAFLEVRRLTDSTDAALAQAQMVVAGIGFTAGATLVVLGGGAAVVSLAARGGAIAANSALAEFCAVQTMKQAGKAIATGVVVDVVDRMTDVSKADGACLIGTTSLTIGQKSIEFIITEGLAAFVNAISEGHSDEAARIVKGGLTGMLSFATKHSEKAAEFAKGGSRLGTTGNILGLLFAGASLRNEVKRFNAEMPR